MYDRIRTIPTAAELLDTALGRASKITKSDREYFYRVKKTTMAKLESTTDRLTEKLRTLVRSFPNLDRISTYERELIDLVVGVRALQRALSRLEGAAETIERIGRDGLSEARRAREKAPLVQVHRRVVGRVASVVEELERPFRFLADARLVLLAIPDVTPGDPTIVLAGYPNVGKSSLLARLTRARPEIAPYPYTTKQVNVGHFLWPEGGPRHRARRYQVVDTPGLLEKPAPERNAIEKQAALALAYLADLILFVLDPSETSGYTLAQQEGLLASVRGEFAGVIVVVVETKADLRRRPGTSHAVSATTGEGLGDLKRLLVESIPADKYAELLAEKLPEEVSSTKS